MKWLKYILVFYLVLLSVIPCCAFDGCPDDKAAVEQAERHESGDKDCGSCSPFFNCEGCASVTIDADIIVYNVPAPGIKRVYTHFLLPFIPELHYSFWQPPRLG
ncbi:MAG: DUF6660 family protein [Chitinophagaceae bacterium]